jgi:hypothetical protein
MSRHCKSCHTHQGGHSHHQCGCECSHSHASGCQTCGEKGSCPSCETDSSCGHSSCHSHECSQCAEMKHQMVDCCSIAHQLVAVADQAWLEVLKEKIMDHIRSSDSKIDQIAEIVAEANHHRWQNKLSEKQNCANYAKRLIELLRQGGNHSNSSHGGNGQQSKNSGAGVQQNTGNQNEKKGNNKDKSNPGYTQGYGQRSYGEQGEGNKPTEQSQ